MKEVITEWNLSDYINTVEEMAEHLSVALDNEDVDLFKAVLLECVKNSGGVSSVTKRLTISRGTVYKALSDDGNPSLSTLVEILGAVGLRLSVTP